MSEIKNISKEDYIKLARFAEQTKQYEDMFEYTKSFIALSNHDLSKEELHFFSTSYKVMTGNLRAEIRALTLIEQNVDYLGDQERLDIILDLKDKIINELTGLCKEIIDTIDNKFSKVTDIENKINFLKLKGDYYRYLTEVELNGQTKEAYCKKAFNIYTEAENLSKGISIVNPIRLGLVLNLAVFYYENNREPLKGIILLKTTLNAALTKLSTIREGDYEETSTLVQLIRDNIALWTDSKDELDDVENDKNTNEQQNE